MGLARFAPSLMHREGRGSNVTDGNDSRGNAWCQAEAGDFNRERTQGTQKKREERREREGNAFNYELREFARMGEGKKSILHRSKRRKQR